MSREWTMPRVTPVGATRVCPNCGADMTDRRPNAIFCKRACKDAHRNAAVRRQQAADAVKHQKDVDGFWDAIGRMQRPVLGRARNGVQGRSRPLRNPS
jgi:hypothetical protein